MEERVAFVVLGSAGSRVEWQACLGVDVAGVKELVVLIAWLAAVGQIWADVVQLAEPAGEGNVLGVGEAGGAKDDDAVLLLRESCELAQGLSVL